MRAGKSEAYRQAIFDSIYLAAAQALNVPEDDQFMTLSELPPRTFVTAPSWRRPMLIQITVCNTLNAEQKALFQRIAELLGNSPGIRREDMFVYILEAAIEDWSVAHGPEKFA